LRRRGLSRRSGRAWAVLLAVVAGGQFVAGTSMAAPTAPASRYASIVLEAETGAVLYERNADLPRHPASLTKIMTLFLAFEALEQKRLTLGDQITMSAFAVSRDPSRLNLAPGSKIRVEEAIRAMTTKSANDAACAIAEHLGQGSELRFAEMMTARAKKLGLTKTVFYNASGLPHDGQVSSARDLALLSKALIQTYPAYYRYFSEGSFEFHGKRYPNQNRFLRTYYGADGIKTGFVNSSGHNLAASALRGGKRLVAIVLGGDTQAWTREHTSRLLDTSYAKIDPSLSMVASNAGGAPGSPATASLPQMAAVQLASATVAATAAAPAAGASTSTGAVNAPAVAVTVPAADPIPTPNGTANLLAYAAAASSPKLRGSAVAARADVAKKKPAAEPAPSETPAPTPAPEAPAKAAPAPAPAVAAAAAPAPASKPARTETAAPAIVESPEPAAERPAPAPRSAEPPLAAVTPAPTSAGTNLARAPQVVVSKAAPALPKAAAPVAEPAKPAPVNTPAAPQSAAPAEAANSTQPSQPAQPAQPAETVTTNTGGGDWSVQVGLFRDATVARRRGEEARNRMPLQLRGADLVVGRAVDGIHVTSRISRLSEADARAACTELQRGQVPCVVVPPGRPMVVATN
jgi:D-alanyl-D-alanine carboxypeptidase